MAASRFEEEEEEEEEEQLWWEDDDLLAVDAEGDGASRRAYQVHFGSVARREPGRLIWGPRRCWLRRGSPELDAEGPLRDCSVAAYHSVLLPARRGAEVLSMDQELGHIDTLGYPLPPLVDAATVCAGDSFTTVLRTDGTVVARDTGDICFTTQELSAGLPPVALLAVGRERVVAVTTTDEAFVWTCSYRPHLPARRIAALCGRGIRHITCGEIAVAETRRGELLVLRDEDSVEEQEQLNALQFPLRSLVSVHDEAWMADATGTVWRVGLTDSHPLEVVCGVGYGLQAVRLAASQSAVVVLTEGGELWALVFKGRYRIRMWAARCARPLRVVPYGGCCATHVVLAADYSGGKGRLRLFARISMRVGVPGDLVCAVLAPLMVHGAYITGPAEDPFGEPLAL
eukprot:TRINITY_DN11740_c0_g2_i1.p1 TRINITY_DN11740_c0_g2~~TRINITY_DN11740_c0_g2_i1.p1  ORF type:complete len:429 (+),score=63.53 TRINITY_DN11740_c0_g2_i1:90-1289(+)